MSELRYRPEIDGLRAIAVAAVVLYHADARLLPGGFVGVDIFFVISGYLITRLLAGELQRSGRIDFAAFYARRVRRLLPAMLVLVLVVMLACVLLLGRDEILVDQTARSAAASLLMLANFWFQASSGGYFDAPASEMPLLHLWSLAVEEQFYLVYPALLAGIFWYAPRGIARRLLLLSLASLLLAEYWVHILPERAFYQMPARFWELALGGVVAVSAIPGQVRARDRAWLPAGLLLAGAACVFTPAWGSFPGLGALPAVLGACLVLLGIHRSATGGAAGALLRSRPLVGLGLVSYSLYLWHWPLLVFDAGARFEPASTAWRLGLCVLAVLLAWISWRWVEQPFRRRGPGSSRTLLRGVGATGLALAATLALASVDVFHSDARRIAAAARSDVPSGLGHCEFDGKQAVAALKGPECWSRPGTTPTVALWGDSHAMAWQPFAWRLADAKGASAAGITMNSCAPSGQAPAAPPAEGMPRQCAAMNALAMRWLATGEVDTLVLGLRWPLVAGADGKPPDALATRIGDIEAILVGLPVRTRVLVIGPLPVLRRPAPTCIARGWLEQCAIARFEYEAAAATTWRELEALAVRHPAITLIDPTGFFCDEATCPVVRDGYGLYWDSNHITGSAARAFADQYLSDPARYSRRSPSPLP